MSGVWRWVGPAAAAAALIVTASAIPAQAASSDTSYGVTIGATSPSYPGAVNGLVLGFALVVYKGSNGTAVAIISGTVTSTAGDTATLLDKPFGSRAFRSAGQSITLAGTAQAYSFDVMPLRATKYEVQVSTGATVDATSPVRTVYVTENPGPGIKTRTTCSNGHCRVHGKAFVVLPRSAFRTESRKRWYVYFVYNPKVLKFLYLDRRARVEKARRISAREYEVSITIPFKSTLPDPGSLVQWGACTKDTESRDGLGLPGHHGCGARRIDILTLVYIG